MVRILPSETNLPQRPLRKTHRPGKGPYDTYRACLAWEAGFHCGFCWSHESDLNAHGQRGSGQMWIEHLELRSVTPARQNVYTNCVYSCRYCNTHRAALANRKGRRKLLNPRRVCWAKHFKRTGDKLKALSADARYTIEAYDLNDPRKVGMRETRRVVLPLALQVWQKGRARQERLLAQLEHAPAKQRKELLDKLADCENYVRLAKHQLLQFRAIPKYYDGLPCSCVLGPGLPDTFANGLLTVDEDALPASPL